MPFRKASRRRFAAEAGAVLMQAVLGLGLMLVMAPIVLHQIQKYNETVKREEAIAQLQLLRKAVTSFVSFDRTNTAITTSCKTWKGPDIVNALKEYGGEAVFGASGNTVNSLGLTYFFATNKAADNSVEAVAGAYFEGTAPADAEIILHGIGQYLFDKGLIVSEAGEQLSNYNMKLSGNLDCVPHNSVIMFVTDAFYMSDYLHADPNLQDLNSLMNTMLVDLNMNQHSITGIANISGKEIQVSNSFSAMLLSGTTLSLNTSTITSGAFMSVTGNGNASKVLDKSQSDGFRIYPASFEMNNAQVNDLTVGQICLGVAGSYGGGDCSSYNGGSGVGDMFMTTGTLKSTDVAVSGMLQLKSPWELVANTIVADRWISQIDKTISGDSVNNELPNIRFDGSDASVDNAIYSGDYDDIHGYEELVSGTLKSKDNYAAINPAGVSEVKDIVWGSSKSLACEVCKIKRGLDCALERFDRRLVELDYCRCMGWSSCDTDDSKPTATNSSGMECTTVSTSYSNISCSSANPKWIDCATKLGIATCL